MILPIIDLLRDLLPIPTGVKRDDAGTEPATIEPHRLYVWPRRVGAQLLDTQVGEPGFELGPDAILRVRILLTLPAKGETRAPNPARSITEQLDAGIDAIIRALHDAKVHPPDSGTAWYDLRIETAWPDVVRKDTARGWGLDVALWLTDYAVESSS